MPPCRHMAVRFSVGVWRIHKWECLELLDCRRFHDSLRNHPHCAPAYSTVLSWCNLILGIWTFFSPWIYGYASTNTGRFINSLCVGVIVVVFCIASARISAKRNAPPLNRPFIPDTENPHSVSR
jgi:hypothetical protein